MKESNGVEELFLDGGTRVGFDEVMEIERSRRVTESHVDARDEDPANSKLPSLLAGGSDAAS